MSVMHILREQERIHWCEYCVAWTYHLLSWKRSFYLDSNMKCIKRSLRDVCSRFTSVQFIFINKYSFKNITNPFTTIINSDWSRSTANLATEVKKKKKKWGSFNYVEKKQLINRRKTDGKTSVAHQWCF